MKTIKPPYIPIGWAESFFELVKRIKLDKVTRHVLAQYKICSVGNASKVVSALKFLKIINDKGEMIEQNLKTLRLEGAQKDEEFQKLIVSAYNDLFNKVDLTKATEEDILNYFTSSFDFSSVQSSSATRLFLYFITKAKIITSDNLTLAASTSKKGRPPGIKNKEHGKLESKKEDRIASTIIPKSMSDDQPMVIAIRGKGVSLDLHIVNQDDIEPNIKIISQILNLHLKKKP